MLEALVIGIVSGLVAAALWWAGIYFLRPCIKQADFAIHNGVLQIKVVNCTWLRAVIDVEAGLFFVTHPVHLDGNYSATHNEIPLKTSKVFAIKKRDKKERNGAWIFRSAESTNFHADFNDYYRLRILVTDEWFNLRRAFTFDYSKEDIITDPAQYDTGRSLQIRLK